VLGKHQRWSNEEARKSHAARWRDKNGKKISSVEDKEHICSSGEIEMKRFFLDFSRHMQPLAY
jgi:hypothetical protein